MPKVPNGERAQRVGPEAIVSMAAMRERGRPRLPGTFGPVRKGVTRPTIRVMPGEVRSLEALSRREAVELLSSAAVGRVVFTVAALPAVVPVTFAVLDDAVVLRTAADTRLATAANRGVLAFEVDEVDPVTRTGWSVVVTGMAELVTDPFRQALIHSAVEPFAPGDNEVYVRLPLTVVTGRRVVAA